MCQKWWWCSTWFGPRSWMVCPLKSPLGIDQDLWVSWIFPHGFFHTWMNHLQLPLSCEQKGPIGLLLLLHWGEECWRKQALRKSVQAPWSAGHWGCVECEKSRGEWSHETDNTVPNWRSLIGGSITRHCYLYDRMFGETSIYNKVVPQFVSSVSFLFHWLGCLGDINPKNL